MTKAFMKGNEAIAEAAIRAGCKYFFGYPITPASEILEYMSRYLPKAGGVFKQVASEIEAINMVYGAAAAGGRAMTASSSPGMSLKMECISYIALAQMPCVIVDIMRGGPGLGDIQPAQSDYFQIVKGGGHGDYHLIVLAPSTVQEATDLTVLAFDLADKYKNPVVVLGDGALGQMMEAVEFKEYQPKIFDKSWALTGADGRKPNRVVPFNLSEVELEKMNWKLQKTYKKIEKYELQYEEVNMKSPKIIIVAYGLCGRIAKSVIKMAKRESIEVGLIRPVTLWPYPYKAIRDVYNRFPKALILALEMSMGQMVEDVQLACNGIYDKRVHFYGRTGGVVPSPEEILEEVKEIIKGARDG